MARSAGSGGKKVTGNRGKSDTSDKTAPPIAEKSVGTKTMAAKAQTDSTESAAPAQAPDPVAAPHLRMDHAASAPPEQLAPDAGRAPQAMAEALARGSSGATARKLAENIERIESLGQRLMSALSSRSLPNPGIEAPGPDLMLTAGNVSDVTAAPALLERAGRMRYLLGDKGYDADRLRRSLRDAGAVPVIPGRRNRKRVIRYDKDRYRGRHLIENAFCRLKDFRRVATRYDKLAANFLSGVALATALAFWL